MDFLGENSSKRFAELVGASVLALEISLGSDMIAQTHLLFLPRRERYKSMQKVRDYFYKLGFKWFCLIVFNWYCRFYVYDRQHFLEVLTFYTVITPSHMDTPALMLAAGRPFKEFSMLAAKDYFFNHQGMTSFSSKLINLISVDRKNPITTLRDIQRY
ncbi:hypothetical protein [Coxiella-like endosymbiont]|uniref:hypothetical protein n=1 Tax=Coxiella-like endosymbiont TaxID=1592897 RepID=UPI00272AA103|nr:hypothetical protein [Coxiella-like endosymbiont]